MLTKIAFAAAALIFTTVGYSQFLPKTKDPFKRKEFNLPSFDMPVIINDSALRNQKLMETFLQHRRAMAEGQFSHRTLNGKVMVLPPDNMPCLVPDMNQVVVMPNANPPGVPPAPMPGAEKRKRPLLNR